MGRVCFCLCWTMDNPSGKRTATRVCRLAFSTRRVYTRGACERTPRDTHFHIKGGARSLVTIMADVNDEAVLAALDAYEEAPARRAHHKRRGAPPLSASPARNCGKRPREVRDAHFTEPKRRRTSGALGASGASDARKALSALLQKSIGFPLPSHSSAFRLDKPRLRDFEGRECPGDSAIGGVYWIHRDAAAAVLANEPRKYARPPPNDEADKAPCTKRGGALQKKKAADTKRVEPKWFEHEPWFPQLNVQPAASGMNPRPPPPFSVWYTHSAPDKQHDWIGVPRFFGLSHFGFPRKDVRKDGAPMAPGIAFDPHGRRPFRPEQHAAIDALLTSLRRCGGGFVEADCGFGTFAVRPLACARTSRCCHVLVVPPPNMVQAKRPLSFTCCLRWECAAPSFAHKKC
jgi:hypothetical protein